MELCRAPVGGRSGSFLKVFLFLGFVVSWFSGGFLVGGVYLVCETVLWQACFHVFHTLIFKVPEIKSFSKYTQEVCNCKGIYSEFFWKSLENSPCRSIFCVIFCVPVCLGYICPCGGGSVNQQTQYHEQELGPLRPAVHCLVHVFMHHSLCQPTFTEHDL